MRLGQIARKLSKKPSDIVEFLATKNISVEDNANTRLEDDIILLLLNKFSPELIPVIFPEPAIEAHEPTIVTSAIEKVEDINTSVEVPSEEIQEVVEEIQSVEAATPPTETNIPLPVTQSDSNNIADIEVIKAPKVELPGLKVIGKIELPQPKKKEEPTTAPITEKIISTESAGVDESVKPEVIERKKQAPLKPNRKAEQPRRPNNRPQKNPISLQREQEAREAEEKRRLEAKRIKELRTQYYQEKVRTKAPVKAAKMVREPLEHLSAETMREEPKTWWGKFLKWLTT